MSLSSSIDGDVSWGNCPNNLTFSRTVQYHVCTYHYDAKMREVVTGANYRELVLTH